MATMMWIAILSTTKETDMVQADSVGSSNLVVRLYSVARGLEDEGQNNIAKLFRAAALSEMYRASQERPRQGAGLHEELQDLVTDLVASESTSESFASALFRALEAFEKGEWPQLTDIPETYVCRFCGTVMVGTKPDRCPSCAARPLTFQESIPVFYLEPLTPEVVREALLSNLKEVIRYVDGVSEDAADQGVWPMRDMMSHLLGAQLLMFGRARRMLEEDNPDLGSLPSTEVRVRETSDSSTMAEMLEIFRSSREALIEFADQLSDQEFERAGYHREWGTITILSQLTYLVRHEQSHLAELEARRFGR
jgi:rubrerythrin